MARVQDEHDIPTADRYNRTHRKGFRGFDWWFSWTHIAFPLSWSYGGWWGPVGYENGAWRGWHLYIGILCFGCRIDWVSEWIPNDAADPEPRLAPDRRPRRTRANPGAISTSE